MDQEVVEIVLIVLSIKEIRRVSHLLCDLLIERDQLVQIRSRVTHFASRTELRMTTHNCNRLYTLRPAEHT